MKEAEGLAQNPPWYQAVSGNDDPELLLPTPLLESLLNRAFYPDRRERLNLRRSLAAHSKGLQPDEEFWRDLSILAAELLAMKHQVRLVFDQLDVTEDSDHRAILRAQLKEINQGRCRLVWETLEACREHFGRKAFDRFLYEAVAPGVAIQGPYPDDGSQVVDLDEWLESEKETKRLVETGECPDDK